MQFIEEFTGIDVSTLRAYFAACDKPFAVSQLYSSVKDEKFVDESLRLSKYRAITDPALFDIVQGILDKLTAADLTNMYTVVRNDITQIVYGPGGFFKQHRDFLSMRSNILEEYTLLICITPEGVTVEGGETAIHVNPHYTHVSRATVTPGSALLFRKDLLHEGMMLNSGTKDIVSVNIWVSRKSTANDAILFLTFSDAATVVEPVKDVMYGQSYAIPVSQIMMFPDSMLAGFCRFEDARSSEAASMRKIYKYECKDCSYDDFATVFKVITGTSISPAEMETYSELLSYYGFVHKNIMVDIFSPELETDVPTLNGYEESEEFTYFKFGLGLGKQCCMLCTRVGKLFTCGKCSAVHYCSRRCQTIHWNEKHRHECGYVAPGPTTDFIILPSEERTEVVARTAAGLLQPYIKFKILFAEGSKSFGGGMSGTDPVQFHMEPLYMTFGDYNNLMHKVRLATTNREHDVQEISGEFEDEILEALKPNQTVRFIDEDDDCEDGDLILTDSCDASYNFELLVCEESTYTTEQIIYDMMDNSNRGTFRLDGIVLPSKGEPAASFDKFHIDGEEKTAFTAEQAAKMIDYLDSTDFIDRVRKGLNSVKFNIPQRRESEEMFFCNENVYATFNFMIVTGVMRSPLA